MSGRRVLVVLFLLTLPLVTPKIRGADEIEYFSYLRSLVFDRDLDFGNEYQHFYDRDPAGLQGFKETFLDRREPVTGRHINFAPIGSGLLWAPLFLLAHAGVVAVRAFGASVAADGFSLPYVAAACYASALYGFAGLLLTHDALRRWGGATDAQATVTTIALWWGTPLLYYMTIGPAFSHATSMFTVALLLWLSLRAWSRGTWSVSEAALIGLVGGVGALVREQDLLYLAIPALLVAAWSARTRRLVTAGVALLAMGVMSIVGFLPQNLVYLSLNGTFKPSGMVRRKMTYWSPHFFEVLADPGHGLFIWTPLLAVALVGLIVLASRRRTELPVALLAAFLLQVWINGSVESWSQAGAFGSRRFVSATPLLAFGLALVVTALWAHWGRMATSGLLAVFVWWNVSLMIQFGLKLMDRQRLEWPRVAYNQLVEVPRRLGGVVVLFFSDRERLVDEAR